LKFPAKYGGLVAQLRNFGQQPVIGVARCLGIHIARRRCVPPALLPSLADGDLGQQLPELDAAVDLELATSRADKERAKGGLDDVLAVQSLSQFEAEVLLGESAETLGVAVKQRAGGVGIALAIPQHEFGRRRISVHGCQPFAADPTMPGLSGPSIEPARDAVWC
jgi:hypothetical protein